MRAVERRTLLLQAARPVRRGQVRWPGLSPDCASLFSINREIIGCRSGKGPPPPLSRLFDCAPSRAGRHVSAPVDAQRARRTFSCRRGGDDGLVLTRRSDGDGDGGKGGGSSSLNKSMEMHERSQKGKCTDHSCPFRHLGARPHADKLHDGLTSDSDGSRR